jgi:DNA-binding NarL/FixJ family response regulator
MNPAPKPIQVLVVDDHPLLRDGIVALISNRTDMTVAGEAANGREAIEKVRSQRPDVILMDLQMPEMSGIDAIIAIRAEFSSARIIVLTTYAGDALAQRALKAGVQAYVLKKPGAKGSTGNDPSGAYRPKVHSLGSSRESS